MKLLHKARMAGSVMLATAGVAMGTAQADSLLAPLVLADSNFETYFSFKVPGGNNTVASPNADRIHYTWIKKGTTAADLFDLEDTCTITNNNGKSSANDMIFQDSRGYVATPAGLHNDNSQPNGYNATNFVGMAVITDYKNRQDRVSPVPSEGGMSGFGYIVNAVTGDIQDYKLLNNHRSLADGDFMSGFTSKKSVDLAWMGSNQGVYFVNPVVPVGAVNPGTGIYSAGGILGLAPGFYTGVSAVTGWTAMVTGPDMAEDGGSFSSVYDVSANFTQNTRTVNGILDATQDSPQAAMAGYGTKGVMDNDEGFTSGNVSVKVVCMGSFTRADMMDAQLLADTRYGGWTRLSISPQDGTTGVTPHRASGAMVYRADAFSIGRNVVQPGPFGRLQAEITFQPETSGHLLSGKNHPNRPF